MLEAHVQNVLETSKKYQSNLLQRMEGSRHVVKDLFATEHEETRLFIEETRLKMRAVRDLMQLQIEKVRRDVHILLRDVRHNVTEWEREYEARCLDAKSRREQFVIRQQARADRRAQEKKILELEIAREYTLLHEELGKEAMRVRHTHQFISDPSALDIAIPWKTTLTSPLVICTIVTGVFACIWFFSIHMLRKKKSARNQKACVLYSTQLESHKVEQLHASLSPIQDEHSQPKLRYYTRSQQRSRPNTRSRQT